MKIKPVEALNIRSLVAGYGGLQILQDLTLSLDKGDFGVVIGPNGSGKSTTVKSVFGLTMIDQGSISLFGKEIVGLKPHEVARLGVGYVPQGRLVFDTLTVDENLEMGGFDLHAVDRTLRKNEVMDIFPILREKKSQRASFLSGGQQQQLSIARALMRNPSLLLLDEPSLGLDPKTQQMIFSTLQAINKRGVTILMVEQNAHQALRVCTKAFVVESGKVVAQGGPSLAKQKRMKELYLGGS